MGGGSGVDKIVKYETTVGVVSSVFFIQCRGLKPNTVHKAYLLDKDVTAYCNVVVNSDGGVPGTQLKSDANGFLQFNYYFQPTTSPFTTQYLPDFQTTVAIVSVGHQKFVVSSADGTSRIEGFIEKKPET